MAITPEAPFHESPDWIEDCHRWRGKEVLTGKFAHWCWEWDFLPVDETTPEFACCGCYEATEDFKEAQRIAQEREDAREEEHERRRA